MTLRDTDSPVRRMAIAIGTAVAIMVAAGLAYYFLGSKETSAKFNGAAIVAAARDYTRDVRLRKEPVPKSVTLEELVALHYLKPEQGEAFRGLKATIMLSTEDRGPKAVVMRVVMPDGGEFKLLSDGSVQEGAH
jgi:hypothetical protein